jgi:arylsulfatase A-like enzyme
VSRPNLLVVLTDQQRADTVGPDSPCETPAFDSIADCGVRFDRCYAPNTVCSPARASLMTGELPHTHGMTHVSHTVPAHQAEFQSDLPTWSERLQDAGYRTGYVGKWHVERERGPGGFGFDWALPYGSDAFDEAHSRYRTERDLGPAFDRGGVDEAGDDDVYRPPDGTVDDRGLDLSYTLRDSGYDDTLVYGTHAGPVEARRDHFAVERAREWIADVANSDEPWCLVVSTFGPHDPFVVPRSYYDRYEPDDLDLPDSFDDDLGDRPHVYQRMRSVWDDLTPGNVREAMACYYAYCTYLDDRVGALLETLEASDQREDTAVVATSDHGDQLGAHGLVLKGLAAFEETYRVPLLVSHPDGPDGMAVDGIVQSLDLAPTLADLGGAEPPECYGDSLAATVREGASPDRTVAVGECFGQRYFWTHRVCWHDDWKYVFNPAGVDELYDLGSDPHETENLAVDPDPATQERIEDMTSRLFAELRESGDETLCNTDYPTLRYAPVGPHADE